MEEENEEKEEGGRKRGGGREGEVLEAILSKGSKGKKGGWKGNLYEIMHSFVFRISKGNPHVNICPD